MDLKDMEEELVRVMPLRCDTRKKICTDEAQFVKILPEEILIMILERIGDPDDLESAFNASLYFRNLVPDKRQALYFPKVFPIMAKMLSKQCHDEHKTEKDGNYIAYVHFYTKICNACGSIRSKQGCSPILQLRLVSKLWCQSINQFYQNSRHNFKMTHDNDSKEISADDKEWTQDSFQESDRMAQISRFIVHFSSSHEMQSVRSPFIGRAVNLEYRLETGENVAEDGDRISELLSKYGKHIWYCKMKFSLSQTSSIGRYVRTLREWLEKMPNLKSAYLHYSESIFPEDPNLAVEIQQQELNLRTLPTLQHLQFLSTEFVSAPVFNALLRSNGHLEMLELHDSGISQDYNIFTSQDMANIKCISLSCFSIYDFELLESSQITWPLLQKCHLDFHKTAAVDPTRICSLLENKWGSTLTDVAIRFPKITCRRKNAKIMQLCKVLTLNLPMLKRFKLIMGSYTSLDFILPMTQSLECLEVAVDVYIERRRMCGFLDEIEANQTIEFLGYHRNMLASNIWQLFPKLRKVKITETMNDKSRRRYDHDDADVPTWYYTRHMWIDKLESTEKMAKECSK